MADFRLFFENCKVETIFPKLIFWTFKDPDDHEQNGLLEKMNFLFSK